MLSCVVEEFLVSLEANGRAGRTIGSYRQRLKGFREFLEARGVVDLGAIGPADVDAWAVSLRRQDQLYSDHPRRQQEAGGLSPATIAGRIQAVKAFLAWCVERGYLERSPASHLKRPRLNPSARSKVMEIEDLHRMEHEAGERAEAGRPRALALLRFMIETGCRVGEVADLRISNLDLVAGEAIVAGKTGEGIVDFGPGTVEALQCWLAVRPRCDHDYVFVSLSNDPARRGNPLTTGGIYQLLRRLAQAAGVKGRFNPHSIRHLVGRHFTNGANLELARRKLRHADIRTTADFYAHQDRERLKRATRDLSLLNDVE